MDADPFDIETLRTCNPAAGTYLNESDLVAKAEMAANTCVEPAFRRFHLNQRVRTDEDARIVDAATWNRGAVPVDEAALVGKPCIGGYDSAVKHDLVAFLATFTDKDGVVDFSPAFGHRLDGCREGARASASCSSNG